MKKLGTFLTLAAAVFVTASAARAVEPVTMDQDGVDQMLHGSAGQTLQNMADQSCPPETCYDGQPILRRDGPEVVVDQKLIDYTPGHDKMVGGGRGGPVERWVGPTWTYQEKVAIPDENRGQYVSDKEKSGMLWGGLLGALIGAILAFAINPVVGVAALAVGITSGYFLGKRQGETQPKEFTRDETYFAPQGAQKPGVPGV